MECHIGVISGDGIGPEIVAKAKKVLDKARGEIQDIRLRIRIF